jgi:hypothetical protein
MHSFLLPSFLPSIFSALLSFWLAVQDNSRFLELQIQSNDYKSEFAFDGAYVFKSDKRDFFQVLDTKAPYELKTVSGAGYVVIHGKAGNGKLVMRYKTSAGEKQSFQYIGQGEVVVVHFNPLPPRGAANFWIAGNRGPLGIPELIVYAHVNE